MKKLLTLLASLIFIVCATYTQHDCLSNNRKLKERPDYKEYRLERDCNCKCDHHAAYGKKSPDRNKCLECGHYHDPKPLAFTISKSKKQPESLKHPAATKPLQELIEHYKTRSANMVSANNPTT